MEDHAPGHLDDFELFRAHAQGGSAVGRNCAQSLPCTPETSWRSRGRRGVGHSAPGGGGKLSLQRADNFEIATNDEPVFYEYVNSLQQKQQQQQQQQQQNRNNRRLGRSPSRRCASQCQPLRESPSRRTIKRDTARSQSLRDNRANAALGSPPSPASPASPVSPSPLASPSTTRQRLINRRPKPALCRSLTTDADNGRDEPPNGSHKIFRVRSFYTTRRGVVNQGDTFKLVCPKLIEESHTSGDTKVHAGKEDTSEKLDQCIDQCRTLALDERAKRNMSVFHVHVLGSHGVGKTTLVQQLMTSEYLGAQENPPGRWCAREQVKVYLPCQRCASFVVVCR